MHLGYRHASSSPWQHHRVASATGGVRPQIVIVGAGFAGLATAKALAGAPVDITIIDRNNFHTFQPLLYQVASAGLGADDIAHSVRGIFHSQLNVDFIMGSVVGIDRAAKRVLLDGADPVAYDTLVFAAGAVTSTFGVAGVHEHAFGLKGLDESLALRNHVLTQFERAARDPALIDAGALTFVIVGGGPTGVELAGALSELFAIVLSRDFPRLAVGRARVVLLEATDHLLGPFAGASRAYALERLRAMGVDVRLGATVQRVTAAAVELAGGETIPTRTPIWVAGVRAHPLADALGFAQSTGGRIVVKPDLTIADDPDTFVIGDLAAVEGRDGRPLPQLAPVAIQSGKHVARAIRRRLRGRRVGRFRYVDKGTMATIGRDAAVAELPASIRFQGRTAWVAWLVLHLMYLVGFRNRLNVLVNWSWNYLTYDRGARLIVRASDRAGEPGESGENGR
jgi:NADH dehydrogenase